MKRINILGVIFFLNLSIYLLLKVINEISNNSIEHFADLNEMLLLVIFTGCCYYIYIFLNKKLRGKTSIDVFKDKAYDILFSAKTKFILSTAGSFFVALVVYIKTISWNAPFIPSLLSFVLTFSIIYTSLTIEKD